MYFHFLLQKPVRLDYKQNKNTCGEHERIDGYGGMSSSLIEYGDSDDDEKCAEKKNKFDNTLHLTVDCAPKNSSLTLTRKENFFPKETIHASTSESICIPKPVESHTLLSLNPLPNAPPLDTQALLETFHASIARLKKLDISGHKINDSIRQLPDYRNPYCLEKIMSLCKVSPYCSAFPRTIYDPYYIEQHPSSKAATDKTPSVVDITKENSSQLPGVSNNDAGSKNKSITTNTLKTSVTRFDVSQIKDPASIPAKVPRRSRWQ